MLKKLLERFTKKTKQQSLELTKKKIDKLYVKWKDYENSFNSWRDKKDFINEFFRNNRVIVRFSKKSYC